MNARMVEAMISTIHETLVTFDEPSITFENYDAALRCRCQYTFINDFDTIPFHATGK